MTGPGRPCLAELMNHACYYYKSDIVGILAYQQIQIDCRTCTVHVQATELNRSSKLD